MVSKLISDMQRVWKVTKKPTSKDYFLVVKVVLLGFLIIGVIGFIIEFINILLLKRLF